MHLVKSKLNTKNLKIYIRAYIENGIGSFFLFAKNTISLTKRKRKGGIIYEDL